MNEKSQKIEELIKFDNNLTFEEAKNLVKKNYLGWGNEEWMKKKIMNKEVVAK